MLTGEQCEEIDRIWKRKTQQDSMQLPMEARHRNLHPDSAELLHALALGVGARKVVEVGGSSGISTIALASAMARTNGKLISLEIEPVRQEESKATIARLGLKEFVDFRLGDAGTILPKLTELDFVLIDCEKEDYIRFFDMLNMIAGGIVAADNVLSHNLAAYIEHVRSVPGAQSMTLPVGQGLEITRTPSGL